MLTRLLPAPLHRAGLRLAHAIRRRWWRLVQPQLVGCRVVALDEAERVLLVRHAYGSPRWMPCGGGLRAGEDPLRAAAREMIEETGCRLEHPREVAITHDRFHGTPSQVHVIVGTTADAPRADGREIIAAAFFTLDALPADLSGNLAELLPGWIAAYRAATPGQA